VTREASLRLFTAFGSAAKGGNQALEVKVGDPVDEAACATPGSAARGVQQERWRAGEGIASQRHSSVNAAPIRRRSATRV
jgi:hypothetical protein